MKIKRLLGGLHQTRVLGSPDLKQNINTWSRHFAYLSLWDWRTLCTSCLVCQSRVSFKREACCWGPTISMSIFTQHSSAYTLKLNSQGRSWLLQSVHNSCPPWLYKNKKNCVDFYNLQCKRSVWSHRSQRFTL